MSDEEIEALKRVYRKARTAWRQAQVAALEGKAEIEAAKRTRDDTAKEMDEIISSEAENKYGPNRFSDVVAKHALAARILASADKRIANLQAAEEKALKEEQRALHELMDHVPVPE